MSSSTNKPKGNPLLEDGVSRTVTIASNKDGYTATVTFCDGKGHINYDHSEFSSRISKGYDCDCGWCLSCLLTLAWKEHVRLKYKGDIPKGHPAKDKGEELKPLGRSKSAQSRRCMRCEQLLDPGWLYYCQWRRSQWSVQYGYACWCCIEKSEGQIQETKLPKLKLKGEKDNAK